MIKLFEDGGVAKATKDLSVPLLGQLPLSPEIAKSGDAGKPFAIGSDKAAKAFDDITKKIIDAVEGKGG
jgi:ATP-binding protein involved in chromosome partitioning